MTKEKTAHEAKIISRNISISWKQAVEISNLIRYKPLEKAQVILQRIIKKEIPVPYKRYRKSIPHRKGNIATGRYPVKAASHFLQLLNNLEANAEFKGLDTKNLVITKLISNKAGNQPHYGRKRRQMRRTHMEIHVAEK
ncbi:50S ribosomal protein L22 [Candidatus Woesearchaeota archaeon]|nr:50S ribosomal protein L22 [Candidatus Woesearchaeota archaeon]